MSNIKIELFDPSPTTIKRYDDEVLEHAGLIGCALYHGKRKIRGVYTISYKHIYGDPLFIISPSEKDLIDAIGFDTINCNCNENDLRKETGLTISSEIFSVKKSKIFNQEYKKDVILYSSEEIENPFLGNYTHPKKSLIESIQSWWSAPVWLRVLTLIAPLLLLSVELNKFLTTRTIKFIAITIAVIFCTPFIAGNLLSTLVGLAGKDWGRVIFWIVALNLGTLILPLAGTKKIKGSQF